jgi:hypothetical protein
MKNVFLPLVLLLAACGRDFLHPHVRNKPRWKKASLVEAKAPLLLLPPSKEEALDGPVDLRLRRGERLPGLRAGLLPHFDSAALRISGEQRTLEAATLRGREGFYFSFDRLRRISGDAAFAFATVPENGVQDCGKVLFVLPASRRSRPKASPAITARFGVEFEIVPLLDPLALGPGAELPIRLRFRGPGISGVLLKAEVWALGERKTSGQVFEGISDASGMVLVPIRVAGLVVLRARYLEDLGKGRNLLHRTFLSFRVGAWGGRDGVTEQERRKLR